MKPSDRLAVRLGSVLSIVVAAWGLLALAAVPLGVVGGPFAVLLALAFAVIALRSHAWGRWRTTALVGIAISILGLLVFAAEVIFVVFFE